MQKYTSSMIIELKDYFFKKPNLYGLVHIKTELINLDNWNSQKFY